MFDRDDRLLFEIVQPFGTLEWIPEDCTHCLKDSDLLIIFFYSIFFFFM